MSKWLYLVYASSLFSCSTLLSLPLNTASGENAEGSEQAKISHKFNPSTVNTFQGTVTKVIRQPYEGIGGEGLQAMLDMDGENVLLHLGPAWVVQSEGLSLAEGQKLLVLGSYILYQGRPVIIASKIRYKDTLIDLRNNIGIPIWRDSKWNEQQLEG